MKRLITFVAIVTSMASPAAQSPPSTQVAALDLTAPDVVRTSGPISVEGRLVSGTPQPTGLEVRLLRMSRNDFRLGDRFVFEVEVKNAGKVPIDFPRSVDFASFVPGDANNRTARINLEVRAQNQPPIIFGVTRLAGSQAQPGSLQRLEPGETMLIRLPGGVSLDGDKHEYLIEASARGAVPVNAVVAFETNSDDISWIPAVSKNSMPFVIRR
jgi:hypothetical protein